MRVKKSIFSKVLQISKSKNTEDHPRWGTGKHHFSFIVQNNKVLSVGTNRDGQVYRGYPEFALMHSENDAYRKAKGLLDHNKPFCVINVKLNKSGKVRYSKPCPCCCKFLSSVGCKKAFFTEEGRGFGKILIE